MQFRLHMQKGRPVTGGLFKIRFDIACPMAQQNLAV